jgi:hypothetical protein
VNALAPHVLNKDLGEIVGDFRGFYRQLTSDGQLRWVRCLALRNYSVNSIPEVSCPWIVTTVKIDTGLRY